MAVSSAVQAARDGAFLDVTLSASSDETAFPTAFNEWRNRVKARVRAPARNGEANDELVDTAESFFDADVTIVRGATQPRKRLWIGRPEGEVVDALESAL